MTPTQALEAFMDGLINDQELAGKLAIVVENLVLLCLQDDLAMQRLKAVIAAMEKQS